MDYEGFTSVCEGDREHSILIGQVQHYLGERSAHLTFLLPVDSLPHPGLAKILDDLSIRAGEMGAINVLAEVKDSEPFFEDFRRCGFSIYGWETIWQLPRRINDGHSTEYSWEVMTSLDEPDVRGLYQTLVPPLVQTVEPYSGANVRRLIYRHNGELLAYVESSSGPQGIYLKPVFHPGADMSPELLVELTKIFQGLGRPVYLQMRSYQAWLTSFLEEMNAETRHHFALLVRHLAIAQYATANAQRVAVGHRQTETSAPITQKITQTPK